MAFVAETSPRMVDNIVYWYEDNTFDWTMNFSFTYPDGEVYHLQSTDVIVIVFKATIDGTSICNFTFTNFTSDSLTMNFTSEISTLFPRGKYKIGVTLNGSDITTLVPQGNIIVEGVVN